MPPSQNKQRVSLLSGLATSRLEKSVSSKARLDAKRRAKRAAKLSGDPTRLRKTSTELDNSVTLTFDRWRAQSESQSTPLITVRKGNDKASISFETFYEDHLVLECPPTQSDVANAAPDDDDDDDEPLITIDVVREWISEAILTNPSKSSVEFSSLTLTGPALVEMMNTIIKAIWGPDVNDDE